MARSTTTACAGTRRLTAAIEAHIAEHYGPESVVWRHPMALDQLAHFPHEYGTLLGPGHTIQNPFPWSPTGLIGALFAEQCLAPSEAAETLVHEGRDISFNAVYFLYEDEMQLKLDKGAEHLWDLLAEANVTEAVDPDRPSVAPRRRCRGLFRRS